MTYSYDTILEELIAYAKNCIEGIEISCEKHKWACERFLDDIERSEGRLLDREFPYIWNEEEALRIVKWFANLRHSKGILAGKPIILTTSQKFSLCQLYGWRHKNTGRKRFKKYFKEVARKNAKSQEEAGVVLYEMSVQATGNHEIYETYCAGTKREQSKIIFNECKNMLKDSPLRSKFKITRDRIVHIKTGSFLFPLSKEDGRRGDGTNPAVLILDEYHQHQTTEFYDLGLGSNTIESLLMIITTAGMDLNYPCYTQEYTYCSNLLNPYTDVVNDEYYADIYEIDDEDNIEIEDNWKKANPVRMSYAEGVEKIRSEYLIAKEIPEKLIAFLTKCLNKWIQKTKNGYMDMSKFKRCQVKQIPYDTRGMEVYVGFDMSAKIDLTSVAFIVPVQSDRMDKQGKRVVEYILYSHSFIPNREKLRERCLIDKVPYDAWIEKGFLTITDSEIVDQSQVMEYVLNFVSEHEWHINTLCFDPANASKIMMDLSNDGYVVEEVYQSHRSLNEATAGFREQVYEGNVLYEYNPLLNFSMTNAVIKTSNGLIKIDKDASIKRIDPVDAILCAYKLASYHGFSDDNDEDEWLDSEEW